MMKFYLSLIIFCVALIANAQSNYPMLEWRTALSVSPVSDLHFLATGGFDGINTTNSAELFNGDEWIPASNMMHARQDHTSNLLDNGVVLIAGGYDGLNNLNSSEIYDPTFGNFGEGPDMTHSRSNHRSVLMDDGRVMISGGYSGFEDLQSVEMYDPNSNMFVPADNMITPRSSHTLTKLEDGRILATGGFNPLLGFQLNQCEIYDPIEDSWETVDPMEENRDNHAAVLLPDGKVLVSGGREYDPYEDVFVGMNSTEIFDPATDEWSMGPTLIAPQSYHQMFMIGPELVLIPGGADQTGFGIYTSYSPTDVRDWNADLNYSGFWTSQGRYAYAAAKNGIGIMGDVMVCGGDNGLNGSSDLYQHFVISIEEERGSGIGLWPNPTSDRIMIMGDHSTVMRSFDIYDEMGKLVRRKTGLSMTSMVEDVSDLDDGTYLIEIEFEEGQKITRRFIVQH